MLFIGSCYQMNKFILGVRKQRNIGNWGKIKQREKVQLKVTNET